MGRTVTSSVSAFVATCAGLGYLPVRLTGRERGAGGGTIGTLVGLALLPALPSGPGRYAAFLLAAIAVSSLAAHKFCADTGTHDDQRVIIDETVGYWVAVAWLPRDILTLALAFGLFRAFDGLKPWPINVADKKVGGGFGVVFDDVLAGAAANLVLRAVYLIIPG
ncbi:MAG TPA: phosphatidylglycerophosphatase A [Elusimicrobiales bacterium]|nr:phosphatidylglycerophosphatase A [Elusimicrobiales bacterium]